MNFPVKPQVPGEYTSENTRPYTKCRRYIDKAYYCNQRFDAHDAADDYRCPGTEDKTFLKHVESRMVSQSFSEGEITVMDFIVATLLKGGDASMVVRHKDFPAVCRKVKLMKNRAKEKKAVAAAKEADSGNGA